MTAEAAVAPMSYAEYCVFERKARIKHEYLRGEVYAMTGGTLEHGRLAMWLGHLIQDRLRDRPCQIYSSDVRVHIEATEFDTYPDLSVVCGDAKTAAEDDHALINPTLVVEILSSSTEGYDRGQKASHYRRIPSLRAYLLVAQREPLLELQVREPDGSWRLREAGPGEALEIAALSLTLPVDEVYRET